MRELVALGFGVFLAAMLFAGPVLARDGRGAARREPPRSGTVLVAAVLVDDDPHTRDVAARHVRELGGVVAHAFPGLLVARIPEERLRSLVGRSGIEETTTSPLQGAARPAHGAEFRLGVEAWNLYFQGGGRRIGLFLREGMPGPSPEGQDSWPPPGRGYDSDEGLTRSAGSATTSLTRSDWATGGTSAPDSWGATPENTSEYLAGSVSVTVFLVQSDGTLDRSTEDWTQDREAGVVAGVAAGLDWIRVQEPQAGVSFIYHIVAGRTDPRATTRYEPISRKADPAGSTGEDLWVKEILAKMGQSAGDRWERSRALAHATRQADGTDWAVNLFVVDSLHDADGRFADGYFAYSWAGGPHLVMTYDNGPWGIDRMDQVVRHELLHCFYALDEYSGSGCTCSQHRGYLDGVNGNCVTCSASSVPCVMISNGPYMCEHTRRQLGWADLDQDGVVDVVGEDPDTFLDPLPESACGTVEIGGQAAVVAPTNRNPAGYTPAASISVNRIVAAEYRVDAAPWAVAEAADGGWGDYLERYRVALALAPGVHAVEVRAMDDHANLDASPARAVVDVLPAATDPGGSLRAERCGGGCLVLSWDAASDGSRYRVYRAGAPAGAWERAGETDATSWIDSSTVTGYFVVRGVDGCGGESAP